jgi:hypothetical protein
MIETHPLPRLCENSEGGDMATGWLHKVRTGSGSDWVVSKVLDYAVHHKIWALLEKTK